MTDKQKKDLGIMALLGGTIFLFTRPKVAAMVRQQAGTMSNVQLAQAYKEMMGTAVRFFVNPSDDSDPTTGTPWAIDLASFTKNYEAVKKIYKEYYGGDLSTDLIRWFEPIELSQFSAELVKNGTLMS